MRNNHVAELLVDLHDLEFHRFIHIDIVIADRFHVDLRTRQERFDAKYVDDHTALGATLDVTLDHFVFFEGLVHAIPRTQLTRLFVRKEQLAFLILGALYVNFHFLAYGQFGIVSEFADRNDAFRFITDVHDHFALVQTDHGTFDHFADLHFRERLVVFGLDVFLRVVVNPQIVFVSIPIERVEIYGSGCHRLSGFFLFLIFVVSCHLCVLQINTLDIIYRALTTKRCKDNKL